MYIPLPTPKEMGLWDKITIEKIGISGEILMENAARQCVYALFDEIGNVKQKKVAIFAGPGNNGGDGFAVGRILNEYGADITVFHKKDISEYKNDAKYHAELAVKLGVKTSYITDDININDYDIIIDALLGTGFSGTLREDYERLISLINEQKNKSFILAIDIPSGLNGYTGNPSPIAVEADITVTFEEAKVGLYLPHAKKYVGKLVIGKIGIPNLVKKENPPSFWGITPDILKKIPDISDFDHKGKAAHVLIIGGAKGLTGATTLCAIGALKAGAGLVTVALPYLCSLNLKLSWPEIMILPLGKKESDVFNKEMFYEIKDELKRFDAVVIGPGMGRDKGALEFLKEYLTHEHPSTIIDADALFNLSKLDLNETSIPSDTILTPHPGEAGYLLGIKTMKILEDRYNALTQIVDKFKCISILKGPGTLVCDLNKKIYISNIACKNLAIGGSGDVLAGVIGFLKARGDKSLDAACIGVMWHGLAGELLKEKFPKRGNLAHDIAYVLPEVLVRWK